jgi:hypothetical protein
MQAEVMMMQSPTESFTPVFNLANTVNVVSKVCFNGQESLGTQLTVERS